MRIAEAARRLGTSARMLRYRDSLGLLPAARRPGGGPATAGGRAARGHRHRQFSEADIEAVALELALEQRYDITPAALAFGLRVLADPRARAEVGELGARTGRIRPLPVLAVDFEKERAVRLLGSPAGQRPHR
jgi:MerR family copper efflux transcriptional regulator